MAVLKYFLFAVILLFPISIHATTTTTVNLPVPYTSEIPNGRWIKPWNNACEEATIIMVEQFYAGNTSTKFSRARATKLMSPLFPIERKLFGTDADSDAAQNAKIINDYTSFSAYIIDDPTIEQIQNELSAGRPVISFHYGYDLHNPNIPWRRGGSYYHVMALVGFDEARQEFIVNDPGNDKSGLDYHYKYAIITSSLHDLNIKTHKANGPARVLFTAPKLVKLAGSPRVYYLQYGKKHIVANPQVFKNQKWQWGWLRTVSKDWLDQIPLSETIIKN